MADLGQLIYEIQSGQNILLRKSEDIKFIGYCLAYCGSINSQNYQDVYALYANNFKRNGYFVDFGATNGKTLSNSLLLEETFGWKGILAEPNEAWHKDLEKNRPNAIIDKRCVYSKSGDIVEFLNTNAADLSTIKGFGNDDEHKDKRITDNVSQIETVSLVDLLIQHNAPKEIDYLSIDTEGSELDILTAFFNDSRGYVFNSITVEHNYVQDTRQKLSLLLTQNGYRNQFSTLSRCDDFYVRKT
jgi:hypothetical protein